MKTPTLNGGMGFKNSVKKKQAESNFDNGNLTSSLQKSKCHLQNGECRNTLIAKQCGIDDAAHLRSDLFVSELVDRMINLERCGYCPKCALSYAEGLLIKLRLNENNRRAK